MGQGNGNPDSRKAPLIVDQEAPAVGFVFITLRDNDARRMASEKINLFFFLNALRDELEDWNDDSVSPEFS